MRERAMKAPKFRKVIFKGEDITPLVDSVIVPNPPPDVVYYPQPGAHIKNLLAPPAVINYISGEVENVPAPYTDLFVKCEY